MSLLNLCQIARMAETILKFDEASRHVLREVRLHPDDYVQLVREVGTIAQPWDRQETLFGLPVVVDAAAPRLPRKTTP